MDQIVHGHDPVWRRNDEFVFKKNPFTFNRYVCLIQVQVIKKDLYFKREKGAIFIRIRKCSGLIHNSPLRRLIDKSDGRGGIDKTVERFFLSMSV